MVYKLTPPNCYKRVASLHLQLIGPEDIEDSEELFIKKVVTVVTNRGQMSTGLGQVSPFECTASYIQNLQGKRENSLTLRPSSNVELYMCRI